MARIVTFGKYKGQLLSSLPENYLKWMTRELDSQWKDSALAVLNERGKQQHKQPVSRERIEVTFGKFKGQFLDALPDDQLQWMATSMYSHWGRLAQGVLEERGIGRPSKVLDIDTLRGMISSCGDVCTAEQIHDTVLRSKLSNDRFASNLLVEMYGKFGAIEEARTVFEAISQPNVYSYNIMLKIYSQHGCVEQAHKLFQSMSERNLYSWNTMLAAFAKKGHFNESKLLFDSMVEKDVVSWTNMIISYINEGHLSSARAMFDQLVESNAVTWNTMIHAYAKSGQMQEARSLLERMPHPKTTVTWNIMIAGYAQHGQVEEAKLVFDRVPNGRNQVTWNALLGGYAQHGYLEKAKLTFEGMPALDEVSWTSMLQAHYVAGDLEGAKSLYDRIPGEKSAMQQTIMLQAYSRSGDLFLAKQMFEEMPNPDVVSSNAMLAAYAHNGHLREAAAMFEGATQVDVITWNVMIFAYAMAGYWEEVKATFDRMTEARDECTWSILLAGYTQNQRHKDAMDLCHNMALEGITPSPITFVSVLTSAGNGSLAHFKSMTSDYGFTPGIEHYNCIVEVLCRDKRLADAKELIEAMPFLPDPRAWMTLLSACRSQGNLELGKYAAEEVLKLDPQNAAAYILLGDIYSQTGSDKELGMLMKRMKDSAVEKINGFSLIDDGTAVHRFYAGDRSHPRSKDILQELRRLNKLMKEQTGYSGLKAARHHSEKLAVAFGILSSSSSSSSTSTIRVINNLRMCLDCHNCIKSMSKVTGRRLVVRDVQHVHHFEGGVCSCMDAW